VFENFQQTILMKTIRLFIFFIALTALVISACKSMNKSQKGAVIGVAGGGAIGAVIGKQMGNTAAGAVIGAAVGGAAGTIIGAKMDKQAEEMKKVLGDAEVRREGEGIVINFTEKVLFGFDQSDLNANASNSLGKLSNILQKYPETDIVIIGHTDNKGSESYNQSLSERRANSVSYYLRNHNISAARVSVKGMGESDPVASNDTEEGRAQNRRVEFVITANERMKDEAKKEAGGE
jgi:outer membrane protein OmpA-like peptidoglycan-associated protein